MSNQTADQVVTHEQLCLEHLDHAGEICKGCGDPIDDYGNTEYSFKYCSFPDCGCDGARLCMAGEASETAMRINIENLHGGKTREHVKARMGLLDLVREKNK